MNPELQLLKLLNLDTAPLHSAVVSVKSESFSNIEQVFDFNGNLPLMEWRVDQMPSIKNFKPAVDF